MPDPAIAKIVNSLPARLRTERAERLGLTPDRDFRSIIEMHIAETQGARSQGAGLASG